MQQSVNRGNLYREITEKIIAELERGTVPWVRPWRSRGQGPSLSLPKNALTAKTYSGINILLLWEALINRGFASCHWLTFKQALELDGAVRKGEKGTHVFYADRFIPEKERERAEKTSKVWRAPDPGYDPVLGYNPATGPRRGAPPVDTNGVAKPINCVANKDETPGAGTTPKFHCSVQGVTDGDGNLIEDCEVWGHRGGSPNGVTFQKGKHTFRNNRVHHNGVGAHFTKGDKGSDVPDLDQQFYDNDRDVVRD